MSCKVPGLSGKKPTPEPHQSVSPPAPGASYTVLPHSSSHNASARAAHAGPGGLFMNAPQASTARTAPGPQETPLTLLRKHWGYPAFRPHQETIIASVLAGNDTLAIMATGGGKSLCYQLPALYLGGLTVVISPLIALMKDQVDDLNARGIMAAACNSSLDSRERTRIEAEMKAGRLHLLFVSPEKCMQAGFLDTLAAAPVRLIAIDEAHCISEWGHNFRPEDPGTCPVQETVPHRSGDCPYRDRDPGSAERYLPAARPRACQGVRGQFQPGEPDVPGGPEEEPAGHARRFPLPAQERVWHRLLHEQERDRRDRIRTPEKRL